MGEAPPVYGRGRFPNGWFGDYRGDCWGYVRWNSPTFELSYLVLRDRFRGPQLLGIRRVAQALREKSIRSEIRQTVALD